MLPLFAKYLQHKLPLAVVFDMCLQPILCPVRQTPTSAGGALCAPALPPALVVLPAQCEHKAFWGACPVANPTTRTPCVEAQPFLSRWLSCLAAQRPCGHPARTAWQQEHGAAIMHEGNTITEHAPQANTVVVLFLYTDPCLMHYYLEWFELSPCSAAAQNTYEQAPTHDTPNCLSVLQPCRTALPRHGHSSSCCPKCN